MRTTTRTLIVAACALALAGCASGGPASPGTATGTAPTTTGPTTTPSAATGAEGAAPATDVPPAVMLPETTWQGTGPEGPREESAGVVAWRLPESCAAGAPAEAVAMRTVAQGSGELESPVGLHQVALLPDADAAVAEVDRLTAVLTACTADDGATAYVVEPLAVGAQGIGLATAYDRASAAGAVDDALGSYLTVTRRGPAITLVGLEGGEGTVASARETATRQVQEAWGLLCAYDSAGC